MWIGMNDEIDGLNYNLVNLTREEFDKQMCEAFPEIFQDRRKPMSQTCMCWGFDTGPGWYPLLYKICAQLNVIRKVTGIYPIADQIKEKFGGLRFYYHVTGPEKVEDGEIWGSIIKEIISKAEEDSYKICGSCGKFVRHKRIDLGWVYDMCSTCLIKEKPELAEQVKEWLKENAEED